jgi:hypothetical protein
MTHLIKEHSYGGRVSLGLILTHPVNIFGGKKPEYPKKTHAVEEISFTENCQIFGNFDLKEG